MVLPSSRPRASRASGYTLIELLVTVSIIAILLGLLAPALARAREAARAAQCASRQHQIVLALNQFAADHFDWIPRNGTSPWSPSPSKSRVDEVPWFNATAPYFKGGWAESDSSVYSDPSHPNPNHHIQYIVNGVAFRETSSGIVPQVPARAAVQYSKIRWPDKMAYLTAFTDDRDHSIARKVLRGNTSYAVAGIYDVWNADHFWGRDWGSNVKATNVRRLGLNRHGSTNNVLHIDGHVSKMSADELTRADIWYDGYPITNREMRRRWMPFGW